MSKIISFIIILLLATTVFGQQQDLINKDNQHNETAQLLHSPDIKDRVWAAYLIGRYELKEMVPDLYDLLITSSATAGRGDFLQLAALDSLIQLGAPLPAEMVPIIYQHYPDEVLILLAKRPAENQQVLFSLLQENIKPIEWITICNLLAEIKSSELATRLLNEVKINVTVSLYNDDSQNGGGIGSGLGGGVGCGAFSVPAGFPPIAVYHLTTRAHFGNVVAAPGRHPVYFERLVVKGGEQKGISEELISGRRDDYIIEYLADLLGTIDAEITGCLRPHFTIRLKQTNNYPKEIDNIRNKAAYLYNKLVKRFAERNLLTSAQLLPLKERLEITVFDLRTDKTTPLPILSQVGIVTF